MFDAHANLAISAVAVAPSPPSSGTTLTITAGHGTARFNDAAPPYNVTIQQNGVPPDRLNAEVARVTARVGDVFTLLRAQEGTTARTILVGDLIYLSITAKVLTDIEAAIGTTAPALHHLTHETGGTDAITALSGAVITTGTIADARLSGNVALENNANIFTEDQIIQNATEPLLAIQDLSQLPDNRLFDMVNTAQTLRVEARNGVGVVTATPLTLTRTGDAQVARDLNVLRDLSVGQNLTTVGTVVAGSGLGTTPLNASQLTTGTVADARLSANVALENVANTFTQPQIIAAPGDSDTLYFNNTSQPVNQRFIKIQNDAQTLRVIAVTDVESVLAEPLALTPAGDAVVGRDLVVTGTVRERGRVTPLGAWIDLPFNAANFTSNVGTWTVEAGDVLAYRYTLIGQTLLLAVSVIGTVIAGSPTELRVALPGFTIGMRTHGVWVSSDAVVLVAASVGNGFVSLFFKEGGAAWPNLTVNLFGQLAVAVA